ncbi:MarR family winged helix-turn-helix transcriptional regulator [Microbacterium proteolyticum]|uniref:MarR family winged helix-turn-helix transcriptional regulator n=2 Tax=Microbacterium TaxID=33882 RepID=UPI0027D852AD|nr:MarR family transcriptional regulator [Microbacterium proteolyticum]
MPDAEVRAAEGERVLQERVGTHLKAAEQALIAAKSRALKPFGLTVPQYIALLALHYLPGQSAAQLARAALVSPQTMATILGNLESKDLIVRQNSPLHVRVLVTTLSPAGEELVLRADEAVRHVEDSLAQAFDGKDRAAFVVSLDRATTALRAIQAEFDKE